MVGCLERDNHHLQISSPLPQFTLMVKKRKEIAKGFRKGFWPYYGGVSYLAHLPTTSFGRKKGGFPKPKPTICFQIWKEGFKADSHMCISLTSKVHKSIFSSPFWGLDIVKIKLEVDTTNACPLANKRIPQRLYPILFFFFLQLSVLFTQFPDYLLFKK